MRFDCWLDLTVDFSWGKKGAILQILSMETVEL